MGRIVISLTLLVLLAATGCKKEDKKSEVVQILIGTWERTPTALWSNDSVFTFTEYNTLILDGSGDYTLNTTSFDSTTTSSLESSWDVNLAGTEVELSAYQTYDIVLVSDSSLVWEYERLDGIDVTETYLRQD